MASQPKKCGSGTCTWTYKSEVWEVTSDGCDTGCGCVDPDTLTHLGEASGTKLKKISTKTTDSKHLTPAVLQDKLEKLVGKPGFSANDVKFNNGAALPTGGATYNDGDTYELPCYKL